MQSMQCVPYKNQAIIFVGGMGTTVEYFAKLVNLITSESANLISFFFYKFDKHEIMHEFNIVNVVNEALLVYDKVTICAFSMSCYTIADAFKYSTSSKLKLVFIDPSTSQPDSNMAINLIYNATYIARQLWNWCPYYMRLQILRLQTFLMSQSTPLIVDKEIAKKSFQELFDIINWYLIPYRDILPKTLLKPKALVLVCDKSSYKWKVECDSSCHKIVVLPKCDHHVIFNNPRVIKDLLSR